MFASVGNLPLFSIDCHKYAYLRTCADLIPVRGRSPILHFFILLGSVRDLDRAGVVSYRSALCPPTTQSWPTSRSLPPTFIVVTCFATFVPSLLITWPYHDCQKDCQKYITSLYITTVSQILHCQLLLV